jgi:serpin B
MAVGSLLFGACSSDENANGGKTEGPEIMKELSFTEGETATSMGMNKFSFDLFGEIVAERLSTNAGDNVSFSPFSASMALAMMTNAFDAESAAKVSAVMGFSDIDELNSTSRKLLSHLPYVGDNTIDMSLANGVWVNKDLTLSETFKNNIASNYFANVANVDFSSSSTPKLINDWCAEKTGDKIKDIVSNDLTDTQVVFLNTLYFADGWSRPFDKNKTTKEVFHSVVGDKNVDMMHTSIDETSYYETSDCQVVNLKFKCGRYSMAIVLPAEGREMKDFISTFDYDEWTKALNVMKYSSYMVDLSLPRFGVTQDLSLDSALKSMGIDPSGARYTGLGINSPLQTLVRQKVYASFDEDGARVAAATISHGDMDNMGAAYAEMNVNRPFLALIYNNETETILLASVIQNI